MTLRLVDRRGFLKALDVSRKAACIRSRTLSNLPGHHIADPKSEELRADVKHLGKVLGSIINEENPRVYENVEALRNLAKDFRTNDSKDAFETMVHTAHSLDANELKGTSRSFSHFLALSNVSETHHRVRETEEQRRTKGEASAFSPQQDSCRGTIDTLLKQGLSPTQIRDSLLKQRVELVLTAHPTEINRRTVLQKHRRIGELLARNDLLDRLGEGEAESSFERKELEQGLRREVASLWASDEIRRFRPTPVHEAQGGLAILDSVLWDAVPNYLRKLDAELVRQLSAHGLPEDQAGLPLDCAPIRFASWMGGDRDGNPNVTPTITLEVCALNRLQAASLYIKDLNRLYNELSMSSGFTPEVEALAAKVEHSPDDVELYRRILGDLRERLRATIKKNECLIVDVKKEYIPDPTDATPLESVEELRTALMAIHESLTKAGRKEIANGNLADSIRRVAVFGLTMVPLDIRQESGRHKKTLDEISQKLGLGAYAEWSEDTKINWLCQELSTSRPLLPHNSIDNIKDLGFSEDVVDCLETFRAASRLGEGSLGAYVISQAQAASDVLAVVLLQQEFGMVEQPVAAGQGGTKIPGKQMMRVSPLFETLNDLNNAPAVMKRLLSLPTYVGRIGNEQEIMVGYSDSAKDAGRLAACWAQYEAQEKLARVAQNSGGIELTFFHGKGGTVGRGGNPALFRAVLAHPPGTISGRFRVTEQGEMITQNFGHETIAERTLDIYTAAVLREKHYKHVIPKDSWRKTMDHVSEASCARYRKMVREEPRFVPYFRAATPELELASLNIGSRPAKRNPKGGVESLRAIPWIFAWTQTRTHLPAWLGVSDGLALLDPEDQENLEEMYKSWPWFREIVDLIAMILSKAEPTIAENYDKQLIEKSKSPVTDKDDMLALGLGVRKELMDTKEQVLKISQQEDLFMGNDMLERELAVRAPYLDALNVVQTEVLSRLRNHEFENEDEEAILRDALLITINGISAGLRNSG
mmetsp:Transcript_15075/g.26468  ORF Transcript_15075/g.26468 Transcript_15075/m.26468 type:complete len:988 (-) Transcript_15075:7279-10242(-)|eukprot:CAMPEP_0203760122 /NCGR_PEP_ID=MMETSP0098-20131031/13489_1 /ASSEMBLY_ACC=CAM_ASM_000208 /TAXON_ID=96639 /ORGANISM=" , Strain NY0313808BC1" /LENGTH=987 /DNA_ID=CAMNT_0050653579 /DNA_START=184 /DNA_END=3147 /DNA_ORIENTATION=-